MAFDRCVDQTLILVPGQILKLFFFFKFASSMAAPRIVRIGLVFDCVLIPAETALKSVLPSVCTNVTTARLLNGS